MAYYVDDKDIVKNIDINYIIDYFKNKGETCIRIMHSRGFSQPHGEKDYKLFDSLIIEPLKDKPSYVYQDGSRIISIDRRGPLSVLTHILIKVEVMIVIIA